MSNVGSAACRTAGCSMLVQNSLTRCVAAPKSAASTTTGAPTKACTNSEAFFTAVVIFSPGYVFSRNVDQGCNLVPLEKVDDAHQVVEVFETGIHGTSLSSSAADTLAFLAPSQ